MKSKLLSVVLITVGVLLLFGLLPVHGESEIYDTVVRLHVLANSDSEEDQALKLKVRDAVLEVTSPLLQNCKTQEEAEAVIRQNAGAIQSAADAVILAEGYHYPVRLQLGIEEYPERSYDGICFPAGDYLSLRVCIGAAEGQNWWCCLFPPLCVGASAVSPAQAEDSFISVGLTPSQYKIITQTDRPVYKVRFKLLEIFR